MFPSIKRTDGFDVLLFFGSVPFRQCSDRGRGMTKGTVSQSVPTYSSLHGGSITSAGCVYLFAHS